MLFKEITIKGFRVYTEEEFNFTVKVLANNPERFAKLITDVFDLEQINEAIDAFKSRKNLCKILIKV